MKPNPKHHVVLSWRWCFFDHPWRREFEQAMDAQRAEEDEDFEEFEEFLFDKLVTFSQEGDSPFTLRQRFFDSLLEYSTSSLCTFV
jgi:hypothetical protein